MPSELECRTMKKFWRYAALAFVIFYILVFTDSAVSIIQGAWHDLTSIAHSLGRFLNQLTGDKSSST
jgi:hypothetical protein